MTEEEQKKAWIDHLKFREQYAFYKRKMVFYQFPIGKKTRNYQHELSNLVSGKSKYSTT